MRNVLLCLVFLASATGFFVAADEICREAIRSEQIALGVLGMIPCVTLGMISCMGATWAWTRGVK